MKALICFHDHGAWWFSKYFRSGFRHCFIAVLRRGYWIQIDGTDGVLEIDPVAGEDYDLADFYREEGYTVISVNADRAPLSRPVAATCVGMAKAVLGIRAFWVTTPYQLYRYIERRIQHG